MTVEEIKAVEQKFIDAAEEAMDRNAERWPIYFPSDSRPMEEIDYSVEIMNMYSWLLSRIDYLTTVFNRYTMIN